MQLSYVKQLIVLIVWVFVVGALFALVQERRIAGLIAGSGFIMIPLMILESERNREKKNRLQIFTALVFLIFSALPIFLLRILNWETDFKELNLFGIPSEFLHKSSNVIYMIMAFSVVIAAYKERYSPKK